MRSAKLGGARAFARGGSRSPPAGGGATACRSSASRNRKRSRSACCRTGAGATAPSIRLSGTEFTVNRRRAAGIATEGLAFYPPLPADVGNAGDTLRFALHRRGQDVRTVLGVRCARRRGGAPGAGPHRAYREVFRMQCAIDGFVLQMLNGVSKLRVANAESHALAHWARRFASQKRASLRARRWAAGQHAVTRRVLDGNDAVRQCMGVVLQNGQLVAGSIYENIAGMSSLSAEEAWEAARAAALEDDIRAMPMQMRTVVPADGAGLSVGQKQRLLIARAFARSPRVLLFDEATSAFDNRAQALVQASLAKITATRIVIAHRLSPIRAVDRIHVLDHGRIVETGTYDDLINRDGMFAALARRQLVDRPDGS